MAHGVVRIVKSQFCVEILKRHDSLTTRAYIWGVHLILNNSKLKLWKYRFLDIMRNKSEFARLTRLPYSDLLTTFLPSTMIVILRFENTKIFKSDVGNSIVIVIILAQPPCQHLVRRVHRHGSGGQSYHAPCLGYHVSLTSIYANVFYL